MRRFLFWLLLGIVLGWGAARWALDIDAPSAAHPPPELGPYTPQMDLRQAFESLPQTGGERARLRLLVDNSNAWATRWRLLAAAERSIDVSYFILKQDVFGAAFLGHLLHKAGEGVQVRILLDAMGTKMSRTPRGNDYLDALVNTENVQVKLYRPLFNRYLDAFLLLNPATIFASDHDKILIVDGEWALIGGRNISEEYFSHPEDFSRAFHDADLLLRDRRAVAALSRSFTSEYASEEARSVWRERVDLLGSAEDLKLAYRAMARWLEGAPHTPEVARAIRERGVDWLDELYRRPRLRGALHASREPEFVAATRIVDSQARLLAPADPISRALVRLVSSAQREILIQSPYLVLSEEVVEVLASAGKRGVAITVFTNSPVSSDNALSQAFFIEQWPRVLARVPGMRIFVAGDTHNLHSKLAVVDGEVSLVGTYNLDPLSMALNSEVVAVVHSPGFARQVAAKPSALLAEGPPRAYEYRIERRADGRPRLEKGRPVVAFGPWDHADPDAWTRLSFYSKLLHGAAVMIPGLSPFL